MLLTSLVLLLLSVVFSSAAFIRPTYQQKGLKLFFEVFLGNSHEDASFYNHLGFSKRADGTNLLQLKNPATFYAVFVSVGSNGNLCQILVDPGSSDLWVMGKDTVCVPKSTENEIMNKVKRSSSLAAPTFITDNNGDVTATQKRDKKYARSSTNKVTSAPKRGKKISCRKSGYFTSPKSTSFQKRIENSSYLMNYDDKTYVNGIWGSDTIGFSNAEMNMSFIVATKTSRNRGILGIGPSNRVFQNANPKSAHAYMSFNEQLKESGIIKKMAYSISFNKKRSLRGSILFGAVDHYKYKGQLQTVPFVNLYRIFERLDSPSIILSGIYLENAHRNVTILDKPIGATLDPGASYQEFPLNVLQNFVNILSGEFCEKTGLYKIDCAYRKISGKLVYDFSGIRIEFPLSSILVKFKSSCYIQATVSKNEIMYPRAILGNSFLRHAYVVYDLEALEVSMAPAQFTNFEDIELVRNAIPAAVKAPRYSDTNLSDYISEETTVKLKPSDFKR